MHWSWEMLPPAASALGWDWSVNCIAAASWSGSWRPKCFASWERYGGDPNFKHAFSDKAGGIRCTSELHHNGQLEVKWGIEWTGTLIVSWQVQNSYGLKLSLSSDFYSKGTRTLTSRFLSTLFGISYTRKAQKILSSSVLIMSKDAYDTGLQSLKTSRWQKKWTHKQCKCPKQGLQLSILFLDSCIRNKNFESEHHFNLLL